ncbi:hypothetical protein IRP63_14395 (plasmid) [Clostridium botulinum]|uniref:hypothetical protein n=1 Tax=Clostridium botulinum TaxID=1491 RepID=UPI000A6794A8|nr:hypothetical protein [Clostridium botulinum]MCD3232526.1 hypothetical protein [Clostridium botulinum D/C]MCD3238545.1 hypothetical protein [Clostridium botulinum D/C]MCD3265935.1 hypothetical protein [Clostridium botulinum D/C]MCD3301112.1 hypothetical protein [Clostridium botulinum D/C]MCD3304175.1 hypothetical protein [Clostridium botulinum D/C]
MKVRDLRNELELLDGELEIAIVDDENFDYDLGKIYLNPNFYGEMRLILTATNE